MQYDAPGRILTSNQITNGNSYPFSDGYSLADGLTSEAYPSGRVVNTCYDGANRVTRVGLGPCSAGATGAYAWNIMYAAHGAPVLMVMGNYVDHAPNYNSRSQMCGFMDVAGGTAFQPQACGTATVTGGSTLLSATLNWGTTQNNGNLQGSSFTHTGGPGLASPLTFTQAYPYCLTRTDHALSSVPPHRVLVYWRVRH